MRKLTLLFIVLLSLSFLSFKDSRTPKYFRLYPNIIKRDDGALYQPGIVNLKFKNDLNTFTKTTFGVNSIDNFISQFSVKEVKQRHPLRKDVTKRLPGDDIIARIFSIKYDSNIDPTEFSEMLYAQFSDIIDWAEPDFIMEADYTPNDPSINSQWHISKINSFQAWDMNKGDTTVLIGIVDSGSDFDHPDLQANLKLNYADPINGIDDDANGYLDDYKGWDFAHGDNDPEIYYSANDHGSHVSGCASQVTDNNVHGAGIGFKVKLRITKHSMDNVPSYLYNTNDGIVYQYQYNGVKVINCSYGSSSYSSYTQSIVNAAWSAGVVICGSAGNEGLEIPRYPASYDNVVSVAASDQSDNKSSFSNYHSTVDITAPGSSILSTVYNNSYTAYSGTSMSSPITAGTVGLIRSKYPGWTPQQVVDRLLLGVDSIYTQNPGYIGKLGTGRVNAFKCLSDQPIVSIISYTHNDSVYGNNDKVYEIGEKIPILMTYKNIWLAGNNVSLRLTTTDPDVELVKDSIFVGNLAAYGTYTTSISNTFEVKAKSTCPFDKVVTFRVNTSSNAYPNNLSNTITITFRQGWATHNINNLTLSLTKDGAVGKKTQAYGSGLFIPGNTLNQMLEGGLMIGINNTKVSDVCRRGQAPSNMSDTDFVALNAYTMNTPGSYSQQDGFGLFNDDGAGSNKIGVTVTSRSYAWNSSQDANYIILRYAIKNTSGSSISNLYAGIYMFYFPGGNTSNNIATLDTLNKLGYSFNNTTSNPHLGIAILSEQNLNFKAMNSSEVLNGFTTQEKWDAMSNGISVSSQGPGVTCFVIAAGPLNINSNDSAIVGFVVVKGNDLNELRTNTITARNKYNLIGIEQISNQIPEKFELFQNYPNPFNPATKIKFSLPKNDFVKIKLYDIIGREVAVLVNNELKAGIYEFNYEAMNLSSGVYFYKIETNYFTDVKKMILLK